MYPADPSTDLTAEFTGDRTFAFAAVIFAALAFGVPTLLAVLR
ncbi:hypothetical protein [Sphingopyxis flava]|uniref:Uncharacterized protein n=1 Tax=Sphingopyxis flava TaxID=1507287 RepID=A0A1T4ZVX7_9SPHN|nr:hypothetical protein [Sphingopyxis flava]SKB26900.1 hypothetical protein SAMN06295937_1001250 [Sphingopyxis flava]